MNVEEKIVVEPQEQLLSVRNRFNHHMSAQKLRTGRESALRTRNLQAPAAKHVLELAGQPMDGVPLRHYSTISPVVS
ncbi:hypothetical protein StoSoilA2_26610 [Arthrobacter sp. StoSoilA2]|nr:hypothetical protein StoSoilA2_26610 [Arthrobacter sp. StoSoilA2]